MLSLTSSPIHSVYHHKAQSTPLNCKFACFAFIPAGLGEGEQTFVAMSKQNTRVGRRRREKKKIEDVALFPPTGEFQTAVTIRSTFLGADERGVERPLSGESKSVS